MSTAKNSTDPIRSVLFLNFYVIPIPSVFWLRQLQAEPFFHGWLRSDARRFRYRRFTQPSIVAADI